MNLKEAARVLGVHYQTAYRWVRAGELQAIRLGARYEVSQAAVDRFLATRRAFDAALPVSPQRRVGDIHPADLLEELEALALDPILSVPSVTTLVARRGAAVVGDVCVAAHVTPDGAVDDFAIDHPQIDQLEFLLASYDVTDHHPSSPRNLGSRAVRHRRAIRIAHVPQDEFRRLLRPELRQYWAEYAIRSLLVVPVLEGELDASGFLAFTRGTASQPYCEADEAFVTRVARRVGALFATAADIRSAWAARAWLLDAVSTLFATAGSRDAPSGAGLADVLERCPGTDRFPLAVLDPSAHVLAVNDYVEQVSGHQRGNVLGSAAADFTGAEDRDSEAASMDRLRSGEIDYVDFRARRVMADGSERGFISHRAAVRDADATLRAVVVAARPLHLVDDELEYAAAAAGA